MVKIVKCIVCGNNIKTYGSQFFVHCGHRQAINESNWINKPQINSGLEESGNLATSRVSEGEVATTPKQSIVENAGSNPAPAGDLEIEDDEPENPLENLPEEKKEFHCPNCNNQLNEYETPCPRCFYDIEWQ